MVTNVNIRRYRPQQAIFNSGRRETARLDLSISREQYKALGILVAAALVMGLLITQVFHYRSVAARAEIERLQTMHAALGDEHVRLLANRAQLASKAHVLVLAGTKFDLFEPDTTQVRRM
jgi:cell division protein FtsL